MVDPQLKSQLACSSKPRNMVNKRKQMRTQNNMEIKRLDATDKDEAVQVIELFFPGDDADKNVERFLENTENYLLVAYWQGTAVGILLGYELQRPDTHSPLFFLYEMEVLETQRRLGIGRELTEAFKHICIARGGSQLFLMTNASNTAAMNLYRSTGGIEEGDDNVLFVYEIDKR